MATVLFWLMIVALRNEKGSYSAYTTPPRRGSIVALRNEKGSYSNSFFPEVARKIVALRNEKGSYSRARQAAC